MASFALLHLSCRSCPEGTAIDELNPGTYVVDRAEADPQLLGSSIELTEDRLVLTYLQDGEPRRVVYQIKNQIVD